MPILPLSLPLALTSSTLSLWFSASRCRLLKLSTQRRTHWISTHWIQQRLIHQLCCQHQHRTRKKQTQCRTATILCSVRAATCLSHPPPSVFSTSSSETEQRENTSSSSSSSSPASSSASPRPPPRFIPFTADQKVFKECVQRYLSGLPFSLPSAFRSGIGDPPDPLSLSLSSAAVHKRDAVFANSDCPLQHITHFGFDFDFTLAHWNENVAMFIYEEAKMYLVKKAGYPRELMSRSYDSSFPIRGLHFDTKTGYLMKLNQFSKIQLETVHRGRQRVEVDKIVQQYGGISISKEYEEQHLRMMADLFCLPEICLLADVIQTFVDRGREYSPDYVYRDVFKAIEFIHTSGILHDTIAKNPSTFLEPDPAIAEYLTKLREAGKKLFLLTNSSFKFVDAGMRYILGYPPAAEEEATDDSNNETVSCCYSPNTDQDSKTNTATSSSRQSTQTASTSIDAQKAPAVTTAVSASSGPSSWLDLFDICIFSARKPHFWRRSGHFRLIDQRTGSLSFQPVSHFQRGQAYTEGGLAAFTRLSGALGSNVIYMGDNTAADLVSPSESALWKTVAIMTEINKETEIQASPPFRAKLKQLLQTEALIDYGQYLGDPSSRKQIELLKSNRKSLKHDLLMMFNKHFGSVFRTASHRTKLFFEVSRYADVYTSNIINFLNYPITYCFYAPRSFLPHELERELIMQTESTTPPSVTTTSTASNTAAAAGITAKEVKEANKREAVGQ